MIVSLATAKNGETTATCNDFYIHSSYNPSKEAERFVESISTDYTPPFIVITEPGLCYCIPLLRKRFPLSKIVIIRYCDNFDKYNYTADYTLKFTSLSESFDTKLINLIGEVDLVDSLFLQWPPSSKIFANLEKKLIDSIKNSFSNAKTLLVTREFFEKKWLLNCISFITYSSNFYKLNSIINKPILIISSGPSLKDSLNIIKNNIKKFFVICLSSAISTCLKYNIIPNLIISTDGGYWAGQHLKKLDKYNITLACPSEAYIPRNLLQKLNIIPLDYGDGYSSTILKLSNIQSLAARRNGTVSGTALEFALKYSDRDIFFCGLDLSNQKGFQHCQPNENELNNKLKDNKIFNENKRTISSEFTAGTLPIYKTWFSEFKIKNRKVYRVINNNYKKNSLGQIKDITTNEFDKMTLNYIDNDLNYFEQIKIDKKINNVISFINSEPNNDNWIKSIYPLSYSTLLRQKNNKEITDRLNKDNNILLKKIRKLLNDN